MNSNVTVRFAAFIFLTWVATVSLARGQAPAPPSPSDAPPASPTQPAAPIERQAPIAPAVPTPPRLFGPRPLLRLPMPMHERGLHTEMSDGMHETMGAGLRIVPPGIWWRDPNVVQQLSLTPEQTKKMDGIFQQSRLQLIDLRANIERQNAILDPMLNANPIEQAKTLAQIDKVAQARAELEKADAKMLLGIRGVLTPDQWTKLQNRGERGRLGMTPGMGRMMRPDGQGPRPPHAAGAPGGSPDPVAPKAQP